MYEATLRCFERIGVAPTTVTVDNVPGFTEDAVPIDQWNRWVQKHGFPTPKRLDIHAGYFGRLNLHAGWLQTRAGGGVTPPDYDGGRFAFISDAALDRWSPNILCEMAKDVWNSCQFEYGYALILRSKAANRFAGGRRQSNLSNEENIKNKKWEQFRLGIEKKGQSYSQRLRDIFPLNLLLDSHLDVAIGSDSLKKWIEVDQQRGTLKLVCPGLWCWTVDQKNIPKVRALLAPSGLLVAV